MAAASGAAASGGALSGQSDSHELLGGPWPGRGENGAISGKSPGRAPGAVEGAAGPHCGESKSERQQQHELRAFAQSSGISDGVFRPAGGNTGPGGKYVYSQHLCRLPLLPSQHTQDCRRLPEAGGAAVDPGSRPGGGAGHGCGFLRLAPGHLYGCGGFCLFGRAEAGTVEYGLRQPVRPDALGCLAAGRGGSGRWIGRSFSHPA